MNTPLKRTTFPVLLAALAVPAWAGLSAQQQAPSEGALPITVTGAVPADLAGLTQGPEVEGVISARQGNQVQVTTADGASTPILVSDATRINGKGGFLGLNKTKLGADALLNGLPVSVKTVQWQGGLVASQIKFKNSNLQTASMIRTGTAQRFGEHDRAIAQNAAATE